MSAFTLVALHHDDVDVSVFTKLFATDEEAHGAMWDYIKEIVDGDEETMAAAHKAATFEELNNGCCMTFPGVESLPSFYITKMEV